MLSRMRAVVTPQQVVNNCIEAVNATGVGRTRFVNDLPIDHFGFCVQPDELASVSEGLAGMLDPAYDVELSGGAGIMGLQAGDKLSWYFGNTLPALVATSSQSLPLNPGGGYIAAYTPSLQPSCRWLQRQNVDFKILRPYGVDALWVPLHTRDWGVGDGYYALCVVTEPLLATARRLSVP